jgi:site-specific DNA-methyltransferase (adenine-specific)
MAGFADKFSSIRQDWVTPSSLFDTLNEEFHFTLDAAADHINTKAASFFTKEDDGLAQDWGTHIVWLNPPYGDGVGKLSEWVNKSAIASGNGATVVMLIPARTNTNWFHDICLKYGEVRFLRGRPKFEGAKHGLPQPLCFVIFRPR